MGAASMGVIIIAFVLFPALNDVYVTERRFEMYKEPEVC